MQRVMMESGIGWSVWKSRSLQRSWICFIFLHPRRAGLIRLSNNLYRRRCTKTKQIMRPYYALAHYFVFLYFSYNFVRSSFEVHSFFVTGAVATCCVYLKNVTAIADTTEMNNIWSVDFSELLGNVLQWTVER